MANNLECPRFKTKLTQEISCDGEKRFICPELRDNGNCRKQTQGEFIACQFKKPNQAGTRFEFDESKLPYRTVKEISKFFCSEFRGFGSKPMTAYTYVYSDNTEELRCGYLREDGVCRVGLRRRVADPRCPKLDQFLDSVPPES